MTTLHREPRVQFLALGVLIFVIFSVMGGTPVGDPRTRIVVTEADAARLMRATAYGVGTLAAFWMFERIAQFRV